MVNTKSFLNDLEKIKCTNCSTSKLFLVVYECDGFIVEHNRDVPCKEKVCKNCAYQLVVRNHRGAIHKEKVYCKSHIIKELYKFNTGQLDELLFHKSVMHVKDEINYEIMIRGENIDSLIKDVMNDKRIISVQMSKKIDDIDQGRRKKQEIKARNFEKAQRLEEALDIYETLEMWDDAGRLRKEIRRIEKEQKEIVTKHIHVDANDLFDKIKRGGLAVPYKCPNCGGMLKITGKTKMQICPFCGSDLDLETLSDFVKTLLG